MKYVWEAEVHGIGNVNKGRICVLFNWDVLSMWLVKKSQNYYIKFTFFLLTKQSW
jgi:hypothetical protein